MKKLYSFFLAIALPVIAFAQIPTNDMESWRTTSAGFSTPTTIEAPYKWYGSDSTIISLGQTFGGLPGVGDDDTDWRRQVFMESATPYVHGGTYSANIMTRKEFTFNIPGVLTNAIPTVGISVFPTPTVTAVGLRGGTPISAKPTTVSAWVQYYPGIGGIDSGSLTIQALGQVAGKDSVIGTGIVIIPPSSSWVQVTATVNYLPMHVNVPVDTFRIALSSGKGTSGLDGSTLYADDLAMTTIPNPDNSSVPGVSANDVVRVYPNPASGSVFIDVLQGTDMTCKLINVGGQVVAVKALKGTEQIDIAHLPGGVYFYAIEDSNGNTLQREKLVISK